MTPTRPVQGDLDRTRPVSAAARPGPGHPGPVVGVLAPLVTGPYYGGIISAIADEVARANGTVVVLQTADAGAPAGMTAPAGAAGCPAGLAWDKLTGLIGLRGGTNRDYLESARSMGKPVLLVSHEVPGFSCPVVKPDNRTGIVESVNHLIEHGRQRIAFVGDVTNQAVRDRYAAFRDALVAAGRQPEAALLFETTDNDGSSGHDAAVRILAQGVPCDAVVAATDYNAIGLIDGLQKGGVRVPEDVAVTGFDNADEAELCSPSLSSVSLLYSDVGRLAASLMLEMVSGDEVPSEPYVMPAHLVVRSSCGCRPENSPLAGAQCLDGIAGQLCSSLGDRGAGTLVAADSFVVTLADHLVNAATEDDLATLPGTVSSLARELVLAGTGMATVSAMTQAARQVAARRRALISAAAFAGLPRLVAELGGECTRILLHRRAVSVSRRPQDARDWFDVSVELLRAGSNARSLQWLEGTEALAACLALWGPEPAAGPASLELVGTFHLDDLYGDDDIGPVCPAGAFPPAPLLVHRDEPARYVTYLLPLRTTLREWGFLAVVGPVWAPAVGTRDIYYEWSTLLSMALDHEQTVVSLREQRENFAHLYDRQTALASALQKSGERYALASKATNDGLWDWQLDSDQVYYSRRFLELLGFNASLESVLGTIDDWLNAVCEEDRPILVENLDKLRQTGGTTATFELELRVVVGPDEVRWVLCKAVAARGADQVTSRIAGSLADITGRKGLEERLSYAALHDALTGLANRTLLAEKIRLALGHHQADPGRNFAILWLDLDRFKIINDSMGHRAGDALLKEVARRLKAQVRGTDIAGRYGGDEFVVLVDPMPADYNELEKLVKRLQSSLAVPYMVDGREISVSVSVGIVTSAAAYESTEDILRDADLAMYSAKQAERGTYAIFTTHMRTAVEGRLEVATDLRHALVDRALVLHYQPIMELGTKRVISLEALVRWPRADGRMTPPVEFLPTACEAGLMPELGDYIFNEACTQQVIWHGNGLLARDARLAVNVSHEEFWHGSFLPNVDRAMAESGAEPFVIEITEGIVMDDLGAALSILQELRDRGFQLHVDDFGTGRSSLEALRDLPVDALKIDRSFIREMGASSRRLALVRAVVQMADALGLTVIAEGIETEEEARLLMEMGCPHGQGYWLARPMGAAQASERLRELSDEGAVAAR